MNLVIMACSGTKLSRPAPAIELYQGVMYETYRAHVNRKAEPAVVILSALHGFIPSEAVIEPYELKMTPARADEILADLPKFANRVQWPEYVNTIMLAGGKEYRRVMREVIRGRWVNATVCETVGGIGEQRSQLGKHLDALSSSRIVEVMPNGTYCFDQLEGVAVDDLVYVHYRSMQSLPPEKGVVRKVFIGPGGPTAEIDLFATYRGRKQSRWVSLRDLRDQAFERFL